MKDFDFDELDKAVSSVLQKQTGDTPAAASATNSESQPAAENASMSAPPTNSESSVATEAAPATDTQPTPNSQSQIDTSPQPADQEAGDLTQEQTVDPALAAAAAELSQENSESQPQDSQTASVSDAPIDFTQNTNPEAVSQTNEFATTNQTSGGDAPTASADIGQTNQSIDEDLQNRVADEPVAQQPQPAITSRVAAPVTAAPAPRPAMPTRRGRFMDVVHPSADMQPQAKATSPPKRTGLVVTPSASFAASTDQPDASTTNDTASNEEVEETPQLTDEQIDLATAVEQAAVENPIQDTGKSADQTNESIDMTLSTEQTAEAQPPAAAPFIEGASESVEKRPLGGYAKPAQDESSEHDNTQSGDLSDNDSAKEGQSLSADAFSPESMPEEYNKELIAVENQQVSTQPSSDDATESEVNTADTSVTPVADTAAVEPASKELPADPDEHAIFDTSSYHQPIPIDSKPAGKRHMVFWILLIVALFIGGSALGALYFLSLN